MDEDDLEITFKLQLPAAKSDVKAVFLDEQMLPVCGAYYGYFTRQ